MSSAYIPAGLRRRVARQAGYRCGYCLTSEEVVGTPMDVEHIIPESKGGLTEEAGAARWRIARCLHQHGDLAPEVRSTLGELLERLERQIGRHVGAEEV